MLLIQTLHNYELHRSLPKEKKVIEWTKEELDRKIMTKCVRLRANTWSYLKDCSEN